MTASDWWPTPQTFDAANGNTPEVWMLRQKRNPNMSKASRPTALSVAVQMPQNGGRCMECEPVMDFPRKEYLNVDTAKPSLVSLCTGYGGLELGIERAIGRKCVNLALSEIEAFAIENLVAKMEAGLLPPAPIWSDLRTFPAAAFHGMVDILCGGYPCQDFSAAGKRAGFDGTRGQIWGYVRRIIQDMRPRFCFFENVDGHISLGLSTVLSDLEEDGYTTTWGVFSAAEVGAPHQRKRVFILGVRAGVGYDACGQGLQEHLGEPRAQCREVGALQRQDAPRVRQAWPARPGERQHCWEPPRVVERSSSLAPLGRDLDGSPHRLDHAELYRSCDSRVDELRLLGNGVVPATAERAFTVLAERFGLRF